MQLQTLSTWPLSNVKATAVTLFSLNGFNLAFFCFLRKAGDIVLGITSSPTIEFALHLSLHRYVGGGFLTTIANCGGIEEVLTTTATLEGAVDILVKTREKIQSRENVTVVTSCK